LALARSEKEESEIDEERAMVGALLRADEIDLQRRRSADGG